MDPSTCFHTHTTPPATRFQLCQSARPSLTRSTQRTHNHVSTPAVVPAGDSQGGRRAGLDFGKSGRVGSSPGPRATGRPGCAGGDRASRPPLSAPTPALGDTQEPWRDQHP